MDLYCEHDDKDATSPMPPLSGAGHPNVVDMHLGVLLHTFLIHQAPESNPEYLPESPSATKTFIYRLNYNNLECSLATM